MFSYQRQYSEKRSYVRMRMNCPVTVVEMGQDANASYTATCVNLSTQGILIRANRSYETGTRLTVKITPNLTLSPPFTAVIEIIRCTVLENELVYEFAGIIKSIVPRDDL